MPGFLPPHPAPCVPSRKGFTTIYQRLLTEHYDWARNEAKLARFMAGVAKTLSGESTMWHHKGECVTQAWRRMGLKGTPSLKALRALPEGE